MSLRPATGSPIPTQNMEQLSEVVELEKEDKESQARDEADAMPISVDLEMAIHSLLLLLQDTDRFPELRSADSFTLRAAIFRYENCWLPLLATHSAAPVAPPLDIAWVWYCHRIHPDAYARDCEAICGRVIDAPLFPVPNTPPSSSPSSSSLVPLPSLTDALRLGQVIWREMFPAVPFDLDTSARPPADGITRLSVDLAAVCAREASMWHQVSMEHYRHPKFVALAVTRYKRFMHLMKRLKHTTPLVPSPDIELAWKAHLMCPMSYALDIHSLQGGEGGGVFSPAQLEASVQQNMAEGGVDATEATAKSWREVYGEPFFQSGANYRGESDEISVRTDIPFRKVAYYYTLYPKTREVSPLIPSRTAQAMAGGGGGGGGGGAAAIGGSESGMNVNQEKFGYANRAVFCVIASVRRVQGLYHADKHAGDQCYVEVKPVPAIDVARQTQRTSIVNPIYNHDFFLTADDSTEGLCFSVKRSRTLAKDAKVASVHVRWRDLFEAPEERRGAGAAAVNSVPRPLSSSNGNNNSNNTLGSIVNSLVKHHLLTLTKRDEGRGLLRVFTSVSPPTMQGPCMQFENLGPAYVDQGKAIDWVARPAALPLAPPSSSSNEPDTPSERSPPPPPPPAQPVSLFRINFVFPSSKSVPRSISIKFAGEVIYNIEQESDKSALIKGSLFKGRLVAVRIAPQRVRCEFKLETASTSQPLLSIESGRRREFARSNSQGVETRVYTLLVHTPVHPYGRACALFSLGASPFVEVAPWFDVGIALAVHAAGTLLTSLLCIPVSKLHPFERGMDVSRRNRRIYDDDGIFAAAGMMYLTMYAAAGMGDIAASIIGGAESLMDIAGAAEGLGLGEIFNVF